MLTSLTLRKRSTNNTYIDTRLTGPVTLIGGAYTKVKASDQTLTVSVDYTDSTGSTLMALWNEIRAMPHFWYLTALVSPGTSSSFTARLRANDAWILNGNLTMVTPDESDSNTLIYTDVGKRALSDEDFQDLEDCCRILRSWLDMAKDNMLYTRNKKWTAAPYQQNRPNCCHCDDKNCHNDLSDSCPVCTTASQKSLALYKQYKALVWLWNYLVGASASQLKIASHPADASGLLVAITVGLPKCWNTDGTPPVRRMRITLQANITSGQLPYLLFWTRRTLVATSPNCAGAASTPIDVDITRTSPTTAVLFIDSYINLYPESTYQVLSVFEIFPYYNGSDESYSVESGDSLLGSMSGYYVSRSNYNYDSQGTTSWDFLVSVYYDEALYSSEPLIQIARTTATPYAAAPEPEESSAT